MTKQEVENQIVSKIDELLILTSMIDYQLESVRKKGNQVVYAIECEFVAFNTLYWSVIEGLFDKLNYTVSFITHSVNEEQNLMVLLEVFTPYQELTNKP